MIRLAIIEDNEVYAKALQTYLHTVSDICLVHSGKSVKNDLALLVRTAPDVVILDIDLGSESGIDGVRLLRTHLPETGVFMLTVFEDGDKIMASLKAGAKGYLLKKEPVERILDAVRQVARGEGAINGQVTNKVLDYLSHVNNQGPDLEQFGLTRREREVAELLLQGLSYKEIAARSFISVDTLNSHVRKIYAKLDVHSRSEMTAKLRKA